MKHLSLIFLISFLLSKSVLAQTPVIQWERSYGGSNWEQLNQMTTTNDGGYILVGGSYSNDSEVTGNHGFRDFWAAKISSIGSIVWQRSYGGSQIDGASCVKPTFDGGYVIGGNSFSFDGEVSGHHGGDSTTDAWIIKIAADGSIVWQNSYGGSRSDQVNAIIQTSDGGYAFVGQSNSIDGDVTGNHGGLDLWVVKLTATGVVEWQKCYGGSFDDQGFAIQQTSDGGYIVAGRCGSEDGDVTGHHGLASSFDMWVLKINAVGDIIWQKAVGGSSNECGFSVKIAHDNTYIIAGSAGADDGDVSGVHGLEQDCWLVRLSATGSLIWAKAYGGTNDDRAYSVEQTDDSCFVIGGFANSNDGDVSGGHGSADFWLFKVDDTGALRWQKTMGGSNFEFAYSLIIKSDGGFLLGGCSLSNDGNVTGNHGNFDYWVVSLSAMASNIITGPTSVCAGANITLTDTTSGGTWSVTNSHATISSGGVVTGASAGIDTVLYTVITGTGTSVATFNVTVNPLPVAGTITGPGTICAGATDTLGETSPGGVWSASNTNASIGAATGILTGNTAGNDTIVYIVTNSCGNAGALFYVTVNPAPNPGVISGAASLCAGAVITLSSSGTAGGTWSLTNTHASIDGSGHVTGSTAGTDTAKYTVSNSCGTATASLPIIIPPITPAGIISGATSVCAGSVVTLSETVTGGIWAVRNGHASVSAIGGVAGLVPGADTIIYRVSGTCGADSTIYPITVNPLPYTDTIMGALLVCAGSSITLSDSTSGGAWVATNAHAIVAGGVVVAVTPGVDTIEYSVTNVCGTDIVRHVVTVLALPYAGAVTGPSSACVGGQDTLTAAGSGGVWTATNAHATVVGGIVTGISGGVDTIVYSVVNACGSSVTAHPVTVIPTPYVSIISGPSSVCEGSTVTWHDSVASGTWTVTNGHASISASGVVTGVAAGTDTVRYSYTNSCGSAASSYVIAINASIATDITFSIVPTDTVCAGTSITATAIPTNGGSTPHFYWQLYGLTVDSGATYTFVPLDGDNLSVNMASSLACASPAMAYSTSQTMHVRPIVTPVVHILSVPVDSVAYSGELVTFYSAVTYGGTAPIYQWYVNGAPVSGATNATYSVNVSGNDTVYCVITSNANCTDTPMAVSNVVTVYDAFVGVTDPAMGKVGIKLFPNPNNGSFDLKGNLTESNSPVTLDVTNVLGQHIWATTIPTNDSKIDTHIDLTGKLMPGNYLIKIIQAGTQQTLYFVITGN